MGLKKGQTNNPQGRPKGSKNKVSGNLRQAITDLLEGEFATIKKDFKELSPKDRAKLYTDLLGYSLPKLQSTSLDIDFEKLSDEDLDKIINRLIEVANKRGGQPPVGGDADPDHSKTHKPNSNEQATTE